MKKFLTALAFSLMATIATTSAASEFNYGTSLTQPKPGKKITHNQRLSNLSSTQRREMKNRRRTYSANFIHN